LPFSEAAGIGHDVDNRFAQAISADLFQYEAVAALAYPITTIRGLNDTETSRDGFVENDAAAFEQTGKDETVRRHEMLNDIFSWQGPYMRNTVAKWVKRFFRYLQAPDDRQARSISGNIGECLKKRGDPFARAHRTDEKKLDRSPIERFPSRLGCREERFIEAIGNDSDLISVAAILDQGLRTKIAAGDDQIGKRDLFILQREIAFRERGKAFQKKIGILFAFGEHDSIEGRAMTNRLI